MYNETITLFNYHEETDLWYPTVICGVDVNEIHSSIATTTGTDNGDTMELLIDCTQDKLIICKGSVKKQYVKAKEYQSINNPEECITFNTGQDFFIVGEWKSTEPVSDSDGFDSGFYHRLNEELDDVFKITDAAYFSLIPHFEIGGK